MLVPGIIKCTVRTIVRRGLIEILHLGCDIIVTLKDLEFVIRRAWSLTIKGHTNLGVSPLTFLLSVKIYRSEIDTMSAITTIPRAPKLILCVPIGRTTIGSPNQTTTLSSTTVLPTYLTTHQCRNWVRRIDGEFLPITNSITVANNPRGTLICTIFTLVFQCIFTTPYCLNVKFCVIGHCIKVTKYSTTTGCLAILSISTTFKSVFVPMLFNTICFISTWVTASA